MPISIAAEGRVEWMIVVNDEKFSGPDAQMPERGSFVSHKQSPPREKIPSAKGETRAFVPRRVCT